MDDKFKIGNTLYLVIVFVLIIGLLLGIMNSNFILKFLPNGTVLGTKIENTVSRLSEGTIKSLKKEKYLLIYNEENSYSVRIKDNIVKTMNYMKKDIQAASLSEVPDSFDQYKNVIIGFEEVTKLPNLTALESYTANGGKVFFAIRPEVNGSLQNLYRKLGIYEVGDFINPVGMKFTSNVFIKQKNLVMKKDDIAANSSIHVGLEDQCNVYIKSLDKVPLLWDVPYQKGKFMVFNGSMLSTKESRGLITGAISMLNEDFIYPIINTKVAFIDDFPAPVPLGINKEIYKEYERDIPSFYQDIWWSNILEGAAKYDVKYTGVVIQTYEDKVTPPFKKIEEQRKIFVQFSRELLKMGGEIGVHGYNHQSLTVNSKAVEDLGYNAWKNQMDMEEALNITESYVKKMVPNYDVTTYVPPSNRIDQVGQAALKNAVPSISTIASLYLEDEIEYTTVQEFEKTDQFMNLPRITSGYENSNKVKWAYLNGVNSIGVFNHFIHPDDILDLQRSSGKKWSELNEEYEGILHDVYTDYPWLKSETARDASRGLASYLDADVYTSVEKNRITVNIDHFPGEMSFLLRTKHKIGKLKNCIVRKADQDVYYVEAQKGTIEIGLVD